MKVGSAAAGWEGRKGRRRRRRQAVAHMQWMSGGLAAEYAYVPRLALGAQPSSLSGFSPPMRDCPHYWRGPH